MLCASADWVAISSFLIKFEKLNSKASTHDLVVPSYGGWIKVRNLPIEDWSLETLKNIVEATLKHPAKLSPNKTLSRLDMLEVCIKVIANIYSFQPASHLTNGTLITVEPFFKGEFFFFGLHLRYPWQPPVTTIPKLPPRAALGVDCPKIDLSYPGDPPSFPLFPLYHPWSHPISLPLCPYSWAPPVTPPLSSPSFSPPMGPVIEYIFKVAY